MENTVNLQKLFVIVPAGTAFNPEDVKTRKELFFVEDTQTIYAKGKAYGISAALAAQITTNKNSIDDLIALIGGSKKTEGVDDILTRLHAVEQVTSKPVKVDGDKVLSLDANNKLTSTLTVSIAKHTDGESEAQHEYIQLKGVNGELVSEVNIDQLVADGMIDSIAWSTEAGKENVLVITWNTASGKTPSEINMSKFIDTYTSGNENTLTVSGYVITPVTASIAKDSTGLAVAGDVWTITDALDKRVTEVEGGTNLIGNVLTGTGSGRISGDDAEEWFTFEEGEISGASGKSALKAISDLEKSLAAGGDTAQAIANALSVAQGAQYAAEQAATDASNADGKAEAAQNSANSALNLIGDNTKGLIKATTDNAAAASNAQGDATQALADAKAAKDTADDAQNTADAAQDTADAAQDTADAACNAITSWDPWETYTGLPE